MERFVQECSRSILSRKALGVFYPGTLTARQAILDFSNKNGQMNLSDVVLCCQLMSLNYQGQYRSLRRVVKRLSSVVTWIIKRTSCVVTWVVKRTSYVVTWVVTWSSPHCHLRLSVVLLVILVVHVVSRQLSIDEIVTRCNYT
jgi:hypothetical protein